MLLVVAFFGLEPIDIRLIIRGYSYPIYKRSIVEAIYRAEPLPYKGYEDVFRRTFIFEFQYDG